jgi:hypothetical protein
MAKESFGVIDDDRTYTHAQIAAILGRAERWAKEFVREHVSHADIGNGLLLVSGRRFRLAIERLSDQREEQEGK